MANNKNGKLLKEWQPAPAKGGDAGEGYGAYAQARPVNLKDYDPGAKPYSSGDKEMDKAQVEVLAEEINQLQDVLLACRCHKVLVVLQGRDAAGKDGTLRGVFARTSPLGVHTVGWKAPTEEERAHDYLWRIHQAMPRAGDIVVFNRSHYEDVLVPVVKGWIDEKTTRQRFAQINDFERMLTETGTVIIKCMLHISKEEQRERLQERIDDPSKNWQFNIDDLEARKQWDAYTDAYGALLGATSTPWAPWTIIPSDSKTHRNLMIGTLVRDRLKELKLDYPPPNKELKGLTIE